jgi:hypothetical protein
VAGGEAVTARYSDEARANPRSVGQIVRALTDTMNPGIPGDCNRRANKEHCRKRISVRTGSRAIQLEPGVTRLSCWRVATVSETSCSACLYSMENFAAKAAASSSRDSTSSHLRQT